MGWGTSLAEVAVNFRELLGDTLAEGLDGHDGDDGDKGEQQAVLHHARTTLVGDVELGLDPGLENVKVHVFLLLSAPRRTAAPGCRRPVCASERGIGRR